MKENTSYFKLKLKKKNQKKYFEITGKRFQNEKNKKKIENKLLMM